MAKVMPYLLVMALVLLVLAMINRVRERIPRLCGTSPKVKTRSVILAPRAKLARSEEGQCASAMLGNFVGFPF
jgi:hypothetical protein